MESACPAAARYSTAMSEENLILARRAFAAINERDLDGVLALTDEDVESVSRIAAIEGPVARTRGLSTLVGCLVRAPSRITSWRSSR